MNKKGFTLVELILAMAFFSFILLFVIVGFIQINRSYTRGITVRRVQNSARLVIEDISRSLRAASDITASGNISSSYAGAPPMVNRLCIGDLRYGWNDVDPGSGTPSNEKLTGNVDFTLVKDYDSASCGNQLSSDTSTLLLDENTRLQYLAVTNVSPTTWKISVTVSSFNTGDLLSYGQNAACNVSVGDQFCDVASLETVVSLRN